MPITEFDLQWHIHTAQPISPKRLTDVERFSNKTCFPKSPNTGFGNILQDEINVFVKKKNKKKNLITKDKRCDYGLKKGLSDNNTEPTMD